MNIVAFIAIAIYFRFIVQPQFLLITEILFALKDSSPKNLKLMFIFFTPSRCRWRCFFSRTQTKIFNSVCQSYNGGQWAPRLWERQKHTQTCTACGGSELNNDINTVRFPTKTDRFVSLDLNVSSRAAGFNLVLSVDAQSRGAHWRPLYDWQSTTVWVKNLGLFSPEETVTYILDALQGVNR